MSLIQIPVMQRFIRMCEDGFLQGWHERNAGNLTYRLPDSDVAQLSPFFDESPSEWQALGVVAENLANEYFITTGSGKYFRNVPLYPQDCLGIVQINSAGDAYRIRWGLLGGGHPTSEFPTHIMNHSVRKAATDGECRVIYHAHTAHIVALSFVLPPTDRDFTRALWQSATECPVIFPDGIGVVPWMVPGGTQIALATCEKMKHYQSAIWIHHGLFVSGPDFDSAFGLMHTIEKAAQIYVLTRSMGKPILQTIPDDGLRAVAREFNLHINEDMLD